MKLNSFIASGVLLAVATMISQGASPREKLLMDFGWKFHRGDAAGAEQVAFDDAAWRGLDVPHDWSIEPDPSAKGPKSEGIFNPDCPAGSGGGFLPGGVGWYRKTFTPPESAKGRRVFVEFEGVYMDSDVWLNGQKLGNRPYGYSSFEYELTPFLKFGAPNVLAVRANVHQPCSRWFSGAGIYRHVWLTLTAPVHVAHWGVYVTTPEVKPELAGVRVRTRVLNQSDAAREVTLRTSLLDARGGKVAVAETKQNIAASGEAAIRATKFCHSASAGATTSRTHSAQVSLVACATRSLWNAVKSIPSCASALRRSSPPCRICWPPASWNPLSCSARAA